ncbi:MAG: hypothetical protein ACP5VQ_08870, partial [Phycisphaerae bacterium]
MLIVLAMVGAAILVLTAVDLLLTAFVEGVGPLSLWMGLLLARGLRLMVLRFKMRRILAWGGVFSILLPLVSPEFWREKYITHFIIT